MVAPACGGDDDDGTARDGTVEVVVTLDPVADAVRRIGGARVEVRSVAPPGTEPHDVEVTPDTAGTIHDADLALVVGDDFQPAVEEAADGRDGSTVVLLDGLERPNALRDDPHVWLDPVLMGEIVDVMATALADVDPDGRDAYQAGARAYRAELDTLDDRYGDGLATCGRRTIITAHASFGHLARRYRLTQVSIAGISPEAEPSANRLDELADLVRDEGVTTIFTETLVSSEVADALAREAGADTAVLDPIESIAPGSSYVEVMDQNLAVLRTALDCAAAGGPPPSR